MRRSLVDTALVFLAAFVGWGIQAIISHAATAR